MKKNAARKVNNMAKGIYLNEFIDMVESMVEEFKYKIEENYESMREEPDSDGETHDKWEEEDEACTDLIDELDDLFSSVDFDSLREKYDTAITVRRSIGHIRAGGQFGLKS